LAPSLRAVTSISCLLFAPSVFVIMASLYTLSPIVCAPTVALATGAPCVLLTHKRSRQSLELQQRLPVSLNQ
jgi:Flp pilus assembly protein TadB